MKEIKAILARQRVAPLKAWRAMRELMKNPDDTSQVFHIIEALKGDSLGAAVRRLRQSERGRSLLLEKPDIVTCLNNREWLQSLPEGSIGRVYYNFVQWRSNTGVTNQANDRTFSGCAIMLVSRRIYKCSQYLVKFVVTV